MRQLTRLIVVSVDCPHCDAHRGELCRTRDGRELFNQWHTGRGLLKSKAERRRPEVYARLREQILAGKNKSKPKGEG